MIRPDESVAVPESQNRPEVLIHPVTKAHLLQVILPVMATLAAINVLPVPPQAVLPLLGIVTGLALWFAIVPIGGVNFYVWLRNRIRYAQRPQEYRTRPTSKAEVPSRRFLRLSGVDHGTAILQEGAGMARYVVILSVRPPNYDLLRFDEKQNVLGAVAEVLSGVEDHLQLLTTSHPHDPEAYFRGFQGPLRRHGSAFRRLTLRFLQWFEQGLAQASVLERDHYVVLSERAPFQAQKQKLSPAAKQRRLQAMRRLHTRANGIRKQLLGAGCEAELATSTEIVRLFQNRLNPPVYTKQSKLRSALTKRRSPQEVGKSLRVPDIRIERDKLRLGHDHVRVLTLKAYPDRVPVAWLDEVLHVQHRIDVSLHYEAKPPRDILRVLRRLKYDQRRMIHTKLRKGVDVVDDERVLADIEQQILDVSSRTTRFFEVTVWLAVHATSRKQLEEAVEEVQYRLRSQGFEPFLEPYTQEAAFHATLPLATNPVKRYSQTMDTACAATTYPFLTRSTQHPDGVLLGLHGQTGVPYIVDRWSFANYNSIKCGASGSGKSYAVKVEIARTRMRRPDLLVYIIDPLREFTDLTRVMGGEVVHIGHPSTRINPFDLARIQGDSSALDGVEEDNAYTKKLSFLNVFFQLLLGNLGRIDTSVLQLCIQDLYAEAGITDDPRTHDRPAPTLQDLMGLLERQADQAEDLERRRTCKQLHTYLLPLLKGPLQHLNGATNIKTDSDLVDFDLKSLDKTWFPLFMFVVLDFIESRIVQNHTRKKLIVVDEAWYLLDEPFTAKPLAQLARHTRHYAAGLDLLTQTPSSFLQNEHAHAIFSNCTQALLLRQERSVDPRVRAAFGLDEPEAELLTRLSSPRKIGHAEALWLSGDEKAFLAMYASPDEHDLVTTAPEDLEARLQQQRAADEPGDEELTTPAGEPDRAEYPLVPRLEQGGSA